MERYKKSLPPAEPTIRLDRGPQGVPYVSEDGEGALRYCYTDGSLDPNSIVDTRATNPYILKVVGEVLVQAETLTAQA